jgi:Fic family protein
MNLDFLGIHPFRDGNGRVSRLLLLLQCYHLCLEVGRYVSLERVIETTKRWNKVFSIGMKALTIPGRTLTTSSSFSRVRTLNF